MNTSPLADFQLGIERAKLPAKTFTIFVNHPKKVFDPKKVFEPPIVNRVAGRNARESFMQKPRSELAACVALWLAAICGVSTCRADAPVPSSETPASAHSSLASTLNQVHWDSQQHGPLLAVDPWDSFPSENPSSAIGEQAELGAPEITDLDSAAKRYGMMLTQTSHLTALVPSMMMVLNPEALAQSPWKYLSRSDRLRLLEASLTQSQWKQLGSSRGLGASDLLPSQATLFDSVLPSPFQVQTTTAGSNGEALFSGQGPRVLTDTEREAVRLHLSMRTDIGVVPSTGAPGILIRGGPVIHSEGEQIVAVDEESSSVNEGRLSVPLCNFVPNQAKPTDLSSSLKSLSASVSLVPDAITPRTGEGRLTVGRLIGRISQAAGLELYADPRTAALPLWTTGGEAPAGDVLQALCLALTSTFRHVGPAFVLTDDLAGIGSRETSLSEASWSQQEEKNALLKKAQETLQAQNWPEYVTFPSTDPLNRDKELASAVMEAAQKTGGGYQTRISSAAPDLQPVFRSQVNRALSQNQPVQPDQVRLEIKLHLSYLVPSVGELDDGAYDASSYAEIMPEPQQAPAAEKQDAPNPVTLQLPPNSILSAAPASAEEAAGLVARAKHLNIRQLWVAVPPQSDMLALAAAVKAAKNTSIKIFAVVSLLHRRVSDQSSDLNILGSSTDWLPVSSPETLAACTQVLLKLTATPGLNGIVLRDTAPPGYKPQDSGMNWPYPTALSAATLGYTAPMRLSFLRQTGFDPIDIFQKSTDPELQNLFHFYPDLEDKSFVLHKWDNLRKQTLTVFLARLWHVVRDTHPAMPLVASEQSGDYWYGSWDKPESLPCVQVPVSETGHYLARLASSQSNTIFRPIILPSLDIENVSALKECRQMLSEVLKQEGEKDWNAVVFDLSAITSDQSRFLDKLNLTPAPGIVKNPVEDVLPKTTK